MAANPQETAKSHGKMMTAIAEGSDAYPKPGGVTFSYGTAGFRMKWVHVWVPVAACEALSVGS